MHPSRPVLIAALLALTCGCSRESSTSAPAPADTGTPDQDVPAADAVHDAASVPPDVLEKAEDTAPPAPSDDAPSPDMQTPDGDEQADHDAGPSRATDAGAVQDAGAFQDAGVDLASLLPPGLGASPCKLEGVLPTPAAIELKPAFDALKPQAPIQLTHPGDGSDRIVVVERAGRIRIFDNAAAATNHAVMLDISAQVSTDSEGGLLSVAFHPAFKDNGHFFVNYTSTGTFQTVVARYTVPKGKVAADPGSALVLLTVAQPWKNHNGGQLAFDAAGYLLIGMGDGGSGGDPQGNGQNPKTLLGAMLRLDVDKPAAGKNYGIPPGQPAGPGWLPEIFAIGLRNPWRFSVDGPSGQIWVADVGQNQWEEIDLLELGGNYGWNQVEGNHCYLPGCKPSDFKGPVFEYDHTLGKSVTGGVVYRGQANPSLKGAYIFGDYVSGRYWATRAKGAGWETSQILHAPQTRPAGFGVDRDGELYVLQLWGQPVFKVAQAAPSAGPAFPDKLSQTNCFSDTAKRVPAAGLLPFDVNLPLWSDGAFKQRWVVWPAAAQGQGPQAIDLPADDHEAWDLPLGTLVIKHFGLGTDATATPVETRFMKREASGWSMYTYAWNEAGTDATLLLQGGQKLYATPGGPPQKWTFPTPTDCKSCHSGGPAGTSLLGLRSDQLDRAVTFGTLQAQQLAAWSAGGLLGKGYKGPGQHQPLPAPWTTGVPPADKIDAHARAWLDVQCAGCHRPGGSAQATLDLRAPTPIAQMNACGVAPTKGDLGVAGATLLAAGKPLDSVLYLRATLPPDDPAFMPLLGVSVADPSAQGLLKAWISGLKACP